jgi:hypothetical protein
MCTIFLNKGNVLSTLSAFEMLRFVPDLLQILDRHCPKFFYVNHPQFFGLFQGLWRILPVAKS